MLGLSTGAYCLGACLLFFMPYLLTEGRQKISGNVKNISFFMLGRLISYTLFALIVVSIGAGYRSIFTVRLSYLSLIIISLLMLAYALTRNFGELKFCRRFLCHFSSTRMPFALGILSGLNPCMPFLAAAARIWTLGDVSSGLVLFFAFFIGTSVYMIPLVFISYANRVERLKQIGLIMAFISGIWFLCVGITGIIRAGYHV